MITKEQIFSEESNGVGQGEDNNKKRHHITSVVQLNIFRYSIIALSPFNAPSGMGLSSVNTFN